MTLPRHISRLVILAAMTLMVASCHTLDDNRLPPSAVNIVFRNPGDWNLYGVGGAGEYRRFIKSEGLPQGYPYTALEYTGFGGTLLVGAFDGSFVAYDLACPVECRMDVRVKVDPDTHLAVCPVCGSHYEIFSNFSNPVSGPAAERGYGLTRYMVLPGSGTEYMVIRR